MAVKRRRTKTRGKKRPATSFRGGLKRVCRDAIITVVGFIGVLYLYNYLYPSDAEQKKGVETEQQEQPAKKAKARSVSDRIASSVPKPASIKIPSGAEIPRLQTKRMEQIIRHEGYTVSYNSDYKIANWVAYELTAKEAESQKTGRENKFVPDPEVKGATATNEDYTRTGYDRGHLAPAGDMKWSVKAMRESFYLSNICPQKPALNRGIWKDLEEQSRMWAKDYGSLLIATGPVLTDGMKRMGKNGVGIPGAFYKVLCRVSGNEYKAIAFIFENKDYKDATLTSLAIPVDSVEKVTGIDFFPLVPDEQEKKMEATIDWKCWSF